MRLLEKIKKIPKRKLVLGSAILIVAVLAIGIFIWAALTGKIKFLAAGNPPITNQATATFQDASGQTYTIQSNTVTTEVTSTNITMSLSLQGRNLVPPVPPGHIDYTVSGATLKIYNPGATDNPVSTQTINTDASGQGQIDASSLTAGQRYDFWLKPLGYLSVKKTATFTEGMTLDFGTFLAGNLYYDNNDNTINISDWAVMKGKWGQNDPAADLNLDTTVNISDWAIMKGNWGKSGS